MYGIVVHIMYGHDIYILNSHDVYILYGYEAHNWKIRKKMVDEGNALNQIQSKNDNTYNTNRHICTRIARANILPCFQDTSKTQYVMQLMSKAILCQIFIDGNYYNAQLLPKKMRINH